jgi:hypothetical protein
MVNKINYTYVDAVLALVEKAKFHPSDDGTYENVQWVDERPQPSAEDVYNKLEELRSEEGLYFIRIERDKLLKETDWTAGDDVPELIKNKYRPYRQQLRDITSLYSNITEVVWPTKPE